MRVELDPVRVAAAQRVFADQDRVEVIHGDSYDELARRPPFDLLFVDGRASVEEVGLLKIARRVVFDDVTPVQALPADPPYIHHSGLAGRRSAPGVLSPYTGRDIRRTTACAAADLRPYVAVHLELAVRSPAAVRRSTTAVSAEYASRCPSYDGIRARHVASRSPYPAGLPRHRRTAGVVGRYVAAYPTLRVGRGTTLGTRRVVAVPRPGYPSYDGMRGR
ncbi:hypothetical protein [Kribbella sp. NPDC000426]|uniref:hypothetical protein n=1 Tax=Kribbella sp. NPDC000426 TaxID=3154255 RepID=UPI003320F61A